MSGTEGPAEVTPEREWDRVLDVNLEGLCFLAAAAIPHLAATRGAIVNLSSDAGLHGNTGAAVCCASKGGVSNLTRALAQKAGARFTRPDEVAQMIWHLAQTPAAPITGANLSIDFGLAAGV